MGQVRFRLLLLFAGGLAALVCAGSAGAASGCGARVIADWRDGGLDRPYPVSCYRHARDGVDRVPQEIAVVHARPATQPSHRVTELRIDERVDDDRSVSARARDGTVEIDDRLHPRVPHLLELLLGKLGLERLHEPGRGFAGGVGDDVKLDGHGVRLVGS